MSERSTRAGTDDGGRLGRIPEQIRQQATDIGRAVGDAVGPKAEDIANRSKAAGADAVADVAHTAEALADTVAPNSPAIAEYVRGAGQKIDRLASDLRDEKVGDLLASAAEFGRSQPVIMLAGAALIGFALSRVAKAGIATPAEPAASDNASHVAREMLHPPLRRPGVVTLATAAFSQTADLLQTEFRLAKAEFAEKMTALRAGLIMMLIGAIFLIAALGMILQALISILIDAGVSPPAAILLVAGGAAIMGLVLFLMGQKRLNPAELSPDRTLNSLSRDSRMVKETLS
jgi:uncharacterized membrane protein YqjE